MLLRPVAFSIPSTSELKITFSDQLSEKITSLNFRIDSLNGSVSNLEIIGVKVDGAVAIIKTRPQVSGNYYLVNMLDTGDVPFSSLVGNTIPFDSATRELFFVGIDNINPFRDRMFESVPSLFELENTTIKDILSAQAEELYTAQKSIGQALSNNYISEEVIDELRTRTRGSTDRLANENAFDITRVSRLSSGSIPRGDILDYTISSISPRISQIPYYPISLQQVEIVDEIISSTLETEENSFDGYLVTLRNSNVIKLLSVRLIKNNEIEDCDGDIGVEYNIEKFKYSLKSNFYDQDFAFEFQSLDNNQFLLSEFGNLPRPSVEDTLVVSYLYKNSGRFILEDRVSVSRVDMVTRESVPTNTTNFFLKNAPIVNSDNSVPKLNGVKIRYSNDESLIPNEFKFELVFNANSLPSKPGQFSVNYQTGEVFLFGSSEPAKGTDRQSFVASYFHRREFIENLDYTIYNQDIVPAPGRDLLGSEAKIVIEYDEVFAEGVDYLAKNHIEVMPELVENRLSQSFRLSTINSPITDVFRILNQTTGEVYQPLFHTKTEIAFSGDRSPEVKNIDFEEANFSRSEEERLKVIGEFIIPCFETRIISNASINSIIFSPGIPAEIIDQNSQDYFFREQVIGEDVFVEDSNIRFFGTPDSNNIITSAAIFANSEIPSVNSRVTIGTKGMVIKLDNQQVLNKTLDGIGNLSNKSISFVNTSLFQREKYFRPTSFQGFVSTDESRISRALLDNKGTEFYKNLSRLRIVGDYAVDYPNGVVYASVSKLQNTELGNASYSYGDLNTRFKNIITSSGVYKKIKATDRPEDTVLTYNLVSTSSNSITIQDLDESLIFASDDILVSIDGIITPTCEVLENYTIALPSKILSISGIYQIQDLLGSDLNSSSESNRNPESSDLSLSVTAKNGGKNIYDPSFISFQNNIIDLKKRRAKRTSVSGPNLSIEIYDSSATQFVGAISTETGETLFDDRLNLVKVSEVESVFVIQSLGTATISIASGTLDYSLVDTDGSDFVRDSLGNVFEISNSNPILSTIEVITPAINNVTVLEPEVGLIDIVVKPTATITPSGISIIIPGDSNVDAGDTIEIVYLNSFIPQIGTKLAIDYKDGFIFASYSYLADEIVVWYEYGDNEIDWSISGAISEGDNYYVSYRYGALRDALLTNFGTLTNIPFFRNFGVSTDRELYRSAISGVLQTFPKGPTVPAIKELVKSFTKIEPEIDELVFGNWILGRDYLTTGKPKSFGNLTFGEGRHDEGLIFNSETSVEIPSVSSISLDQGTIDMWIRPEWSGISNDAELTFQIDKIGIDKDNLIQNSDPFDFNNNWSLLPSPITVGSTDATGVGIRISNYKSDSTQDGGLDSGIFALYKEKGNLGRNQDMSLRAILKSESFGAQINDLRRIEYYENYKSVLCEDETPDEVFFTVGIHGPSNIVDGPWPFQLFNPVTRYSSGSVLFADTYKVGGFNLNLTEVPNFDLQVDQISGDEIDNFSGPYSLRSCKCEVVSSVDNLSGFNDLSIRIDMVSGFDLSDFKSAVNIIDNSPSIFMISDQNGSLYQVIGFYNNTDLITDSIPDLFTGVLVKKFAENNQALRNLNSEEINSSMPLGYLRMMFKNVEVLTKFDHSKSSQFFGFKKFHLVNWGHDTELYIQKNIKTNQVYFSINKYSGKLFYTDLFYLCNFQIDLDIDSESLSGFIVGNLDGNYISDINLSQFYGTVTNRFSNKDVYIGPESFNPDSSTFSISKNDSSVEVIGQPNNLFDSEGIFVWFDDLCSINSERQAGQWVFKTKSNKSAITPFDVEISQDNYNILYETVPSYHKFSGVITTDGEFSSVVRSREDSDLCSPDSSKRAKFKFCGNGLLEEGGWSKIEDSESELINVIVGGRYTSVESWNKDGDFDTSTQDGIYRAGPSTEGLECLGGQSRLVADIISSDNFDYTISMRVIDVGDNIIGMSSGSFTGIYSGNLTGISPIVISNKVINAKLQLAFDSGGSHLICLIDSEINEILGTVPYNWNDSGFHEYRMVCNTEDNRVSIYVDQLIAFEFMISDFVVPSSNPMVGVTLLDSETVDPSEFYLFNSGNIIDIDLIYGDFYEEFSNSKLESSDVIISTDSKVEFEFNIDGLDGYLDAYDAYDAYDGYSLDMGIDEMLLCSDKIRYLVDSKNNDEQRFSIFKDGKGFLNFRIVDASRSNGKDMSVYNLATNIKNFVAGEVHHIAASWKFNSVDEKDEMHLFIDGQEAPNIFKFGGKVPVKLNDKFRDVSREVLYDFFTNNIDFCKSYTMGVVSAGSSIFQSPQPIFSQDMIGRSVIIKNSTIAGSLIGQEYIIRSVIDSNQVTFGSGDNLSLITFQVSTSDIEFELPPTAGLSNKILTDLRNVKFAIFRKAQDGVKEEMAGVGYQVVDGEYSVVSGFNATNPKFRYNIDTRVIEFIGRDEDCNYFQTVLLSDAEVSIKTFGLNIENCKFTLGLTTSSYVSQESDIFNEMSVIRTRGKEPISLKDVSIRRIVMENTIIESSEPIISGDRYLIDFNFPLESELGYNKLTSESGQLIKQNLGRKLSVVFDSDNVDFCDFDGYDGYTEASSTITITGETTDGSNFETFLISKNGQIDGSKFFIRVDEVYGSLLTIDNDYSESGMIKIIETDPISTPNNGGESAEVYDYKNGHFILSVSGSDSESPFEIPPGYYTVEYPSYLNITLNSLGDKIQIGSDYKRMNNFGGIIDQFRIISEMSSDTRVAELETSGTRSVTDDFNLSTPYCADSKTLALIPFDSPFDLQSRRLRRLRFLDTQLNESFGLNRREKDTLLPLVNNYEEFFRAMMNFGYSPDDSNRAYVETHMADGGPIFNTANFYQNVNEFPRSDKSVNSKFGLSGNFSTGRGLVYLNNDGKFRSPQGTIELWISPTVDTFVDRERRYYVDISSASRERVISRDSNTIVLPNAASEIISVTLVSSSSEYREFYSEVERGTILFDEISRSKLSGRLEGGTGSLKNFGSHSVLSADGKVIKLAESLPKNNVDVIVTYIPLGSSKDRVSIFKTEDNNIVFSITAGGIDNVISVDVDWKKNTWHRIMCTYRTGTDNDSMRMFVDGQEGGFIKYGTGIVYGTGFVYGQYISRPGQIRTRKFNIPLSNDLKLIAIGSDTMGYNNCRSRIDNLRFSRVIRDVFRASNGDYVDLGYSSNLSSAVPVILDDATTFILDFDASLNVVDNFATVIDPVSGIYNFDVEVYDNFDRVIGVDDGAIEDLIVDLVNRLKPAHTNALVRFKKPKC